MCPLTRGPFWHRFFEPQPMRFGSSTGPARIVARIHPVSPRLRDSPAKATRRGRLIELAPSGCYLQIRIQAVVEWA